MQGGPLRLISVSYHRLPKSVKRRAEHPSRRSRTAITILLMERVCFYLRETFDVVGLDPRTLSYR